MSGVDEPLADSGVVDAGREVAVGGYSLDFEPLIGEELGLLAAGGGLWVGVHGGLAGVCARLAHRTVCGSIPRGWRGS